MKSGHRYVFAGFEVDTATRELKRHGAERELSPRTFDLLVHLIDHRDRVVSKDELIEQVWGGAVLSDGVVARAVMKARQALGEEACLGESIIKTVHRVGYRFMAPVHVEAVPAPAPSHADATALEMTDAPHGPAVPPAPPAVDRPLVAVLPVLNRDDNDRLVWVELGLLTLVHHALETDARMSLVSISSVLKAMEDVPPDTPFDAVARSIHHATGAGWVVLAGVRQGSDGFHADYRMRDVEDERTHSGIIHSREPTELAYQLATQLERAVFDAAAAVVQPCVSDPLARELFARAAQAHGREAHAQALNLIRVVEDLVPGQASVRLLHLQIACRMLLPEAPESGESLLRDVLATGQHRLAAEVHLALAEWRAGLHGEDEQARHHFEESLRLAGAARTEPWASSIYLAAATHAIRERRDGEARRLLAWAALSDDRVLRLRAAGERACLEGAVGRFVAARDLWLELLSEWQDVGVRRRIMRSHVNLAYLESAMGDLEATVSHARLALDSFSDSFVDGEICWDLCALAVRFGDAGLRAELDRIVRLDAVRTERLAGMPRAWATAAHAQARLVQRDHDGARAMMREAVAIAAELGQASWLAHAASLAVYTSARTGRLEAALEDAILFARDTVVVDRRHLDGVVRHMQGVLDHAEGHVPEAGRHIDAALDLMAAGRFRVLACLDAAWLALDQGRVAEARRRVADTHAWLLRHPIGRAVCERLRDAEQAVSPVGRGLTDFLGLPSSWSLAGMSLVPAPSRGDIREDLAFAR